MDGKQVSTATLVVWSRKLFMKRIHGGYRVKIINYSNRSRRYEAIINRAKKVFASFRQLFLSITGREPTMGCDRYFKLGKYKRPNPVESVLETTLDIFKSPPEGIDLAIKHKDVLRMMKGRFKPIVATIVRLGMPEEDILQEIYKGILVRNRGKCPWDSDKGSFGSYIHMIIRGILYNLYTREKRRHNRECLGISEHVEQTLADKKPYLSEVVGIKDSISDLRFWIGQRPDSHKSDAKLAGVILPYVYLGLRRGEIAKKLDLPGPKVTRALSYLRTNSPVWLNAVQV